MHFLSGNVDDSDRSFTKKKRASPIFMSLIHLTSMQ